MPTRSPMPFMKLYTSLLDEARFNRLPEPAQLRYIKLLMLAGQLDAGGAFVEDGEELTVSDLAWRLRIPAEQLAQELEQLSGESLIIKNGRGWELSRFAEEQGPSQAEKRARWAERQRRHREKKPVTRDNSVTGALVTRLESESESESELESSKKESSSSPAQTQKKSGRTDEDDKSLTTVLQICGVPKNFQTQIRRDASITTDDIWAELAHCYSRPDVVREPAQIMPRNLLRGERPSAQFYERSAWERYIPRSILRAAGILTEALSDDDEEELPDVVVDTRNQPRPHPDGQRAWDAVLQSARGELAPAAQRRLDGTVAVGLDANVLTVAVPDAETRDWLQTRYAKQAQRRLVGALNTPAPRLELVVYQEAIA